MTIDTIDKMWDDFRQAVVPIDAPSIQIVETKRGFYGGIIALLDNLSVMAEHLNNNDGSEVLNRWKTETEEFAKHPF